MNRRSFLKTALGAFPLLISAKAMGLNGPGANDTVNVGLIGLGGRCRDIAKTCAGVPGMRIVAVCDCFEPRINAFIGEMGPNEGWHGYTDLRRMFEKENLDAAMVITTTHARAWVASQAMAAGLDTYIEKPICLTIDEGRDLVRLARKFKRVTQVGTQQRSIPLNNWASDLVKNGALGKVTSVLAPNFIGPERWTPMPGQALPEGGDEDWWDVWTNQTELRPYHKELHRNWAKWWDYDGGGLSFGVTGWGAHSYDQIQRGLGTSDTGPVEIVLDEAVRTMPAGAFEERQPGEDETGAPYYHMVKKSAGPRAKVRMKYANGAELRLEQDADHSPGLGCVFVGENGRIEINRDRISSDRQELMAGPDRPPTLSVLETHPHIENWIECIRTRERCNADIEFGHRSNSLCCLVNIARDMGKVGVPLLWDPAEEKFTNCDEANEMLSRPRRKGYKLRTRRIMRRG